MSEIADRFRLDTIYNEDCFITMGGVPDGSFDTILTSPFYNTNMKASNGRTLQNTSTKDGQYDYVRYDTFSDVMTNDAYCEFTRALFEEFNRILKSNGQVLYNISYGSENTDCMFRAINEIIINTNFSIADVIGWKKRSAMPNTCSSNKLTRIFEFVFVFCRKDEIKTFHCNKKVTSIRPTGQKMYEGIMNIIEAPNNDGPCPYNKATFSSELCEKLINLYTPYNGVVYDPFMGSGTTAVACKRTGRYYVGSEISANQCKWAEDRIAAIDLVAT